MKVVLDTNVLISAFLFKGLAADIYQYCFLSHTIHVSPWLVDEFAGILRKKFAIPEELLTAAIAHLRAGSITTIPDGNLPDACRDRDDNNLLQFAACCRAEYLITGDQDLLVLKRYGDTRILSPREFWMLTR